MFVLTWHDMVPTALHLTDCYSPPVGHLTAQSTYLQNDKDMDASSLQDVFAELIAETPVRLTQKFPKSLSQDI